MGGGSSLGEEYVRKTLPDRKIKYWIPRRDEPSGFHWLHQGNMASSTYHRVLVFYRVSLQDSQECELPLSLEPFKKGCFCR